MVDFEKYRTVSMQEMLKTGGGAAGGLTVRDYFAAAALPVVMEIGENVDYESRNERISETARISYAIADAMMKERNKPAQQPTPSVEEAFGLEK